jgi:hypothetical protein
VRHRPGSLKEPVGAIQPSGLRPMGVDDSEVGLLDSDEFEVSAIAPGQNFTIVTHPLTNECLA